MKIVKRGRGFYRGDEPCLVRVIQERGERIFYLEWGDENGRAVFGVRAGPFDTIGQALSEAARRTRGTVSWS